MQLLLNVVAMASWLVVPLYHDANPRCDDGSLSRHLESGERSATSTLVKHIPVVVDSPSLLASEKVNQPVLDSPSLDRLCTQERSALSDERELRYYIRCDETGHGLIFDKTFFRCDESGHGLILIFDKTFFASSSMNTFGGWNGSNWSN